MVFSQKNGFSLTLFKKVLPTEKSFIPNDKCRLKIEVTKFTALNKTLELSPSSWYFSVGLFDAVWFAFVIGMYAVVVVLDGLVAVCF